LAGSNRGGGRRRGDGAARHGASKPGSEAPYGRLPVYGGGFPGYAGPGLRRLGGGFAYAQGMERVRIVDRSWGDRRSIVDRAGVGGGSTRGRRVSGARESMQERQADGLERIASRAPAEALDCSLLTIDGRLNRASGTSLGSLYFDTRQTTALTQVLVLSSGHIPQRTSAYIGAKNGETLSILRAHVRYVSALLRLIVCWC